MSILIDHYRIDLTAFGLVATIIFFLPVFISMIVSVTAIVRIVQRAGFSGWWVLLVLVPGVNILAFWYFAFAEWPASRASPSDAISPAPHS